MVLLFFTVYGHHKQPTATEMKTAHAGLYGRPSVIDTS